MAVKLRKKKLVGGNVSLYLDIYHHGKRQYEFLSVYLTGDKFTDKETVKLAETVCAQRQLELSNSEHGFIPHFKKKANFVDYFERLVLDKPKTEKAWRNTLKHLKDYTGGHIRFVAVTDVWLEEFKSYILTKVSQNTARTYFSKVKTTLKRAVKDKIIVANPADLVDQIKARDIERIFLTLEEVQNLAQTPCHDYEVKRAFLFSCFTGLRISDIRQLQWQNIKEDSIEYRQRKTKGFEYLHLSKTARDILAERPNPKILNMQNTNVFNLPSNAQLGKVLREWCQNAGIDKHVTFHTARHTFATLVLTRGGDLYTVSKLLGHKDIQSTQIYAKIVDEKKKAAMELLPTIEVRK